MKQSGYRTIFHIYLIFFLALLGTVVLAGCFFSLTFSIQTPDGRARSNWPREFTEEFEEQIIFYDGLPKVSQAGMSLLQDNETGIQIINPSGHEVYSYRKPEQAPAAYSSAELLQLFLPGKSDTGRASAFWGTVSCNGTDYTYILYFPLDILNITMYVNGEEFAGGKAIVLPILTVLSIIIIFSGVLYGIYTAKAMKRLVCSIQEISLRSYLPVHDDGVFHDLYDSLNLLDTEIRTSDKLRIGTEKMREEWIANITHDLKTPLSPIKGYAEILREDGGKSNEQSRDYAEIMLKNVTYMEALIDDLKLTYQLDSGMIPADCREQDFIRFLKELAIDILNTPEFEKRVIHFECPAEDIPFSFDKTLLTRAFRNLIINAFVHGEEQTEVILSVSVSDTSISVQVADNGKGMETETIEHLFDRYYRGTNTGEKPEGSGLGMAIAKSIIELQGGSITVFSIPASGTAFRIEFPYVKVN